MTVSALLTEEECYLVAILADPSGLDVAEFCWQAPENDDNCFRAWPFQWAWWKCDDPLQINQCSRSIGKSLSIKVRGFAFPFVHPGQEMVVTAPELVHLEPIVNLIETQVDRTRLSREMRRKPATHRPFMLEFYGGARIIGRIPQRTGAGIKGCIGEDALVLTKRGLVKACDVTKNDYIWSHESRWAKVLGVDTFFDDNCYRLEGRGSRPTIVNDRHRVLVRRNRAQRWAKRDLGPLEWVTIDCLIEESCFNWVGVTSFPSSEALPVPEPEWYRRSLDMTSDDFWWMVGRWLADGYSTLQNLKSGNRGRGKINFVVHPDDQEEILLRLKRLGFDPYVKERAHSSADLVEISCTPLVYWLKEHFGELAQGKRLPSFLYFLPDSNRQAILDGYLSGDGNHTFEHPRHSAGSASSELILGLGILGQTLGLGAGYSVSQVKVTEIMGIPLKKKPFDSWKLRLSIKGFAVFESGFVAHLLRKVVPIGRSRVVNIVSADHSYLANGIFHHNTHPLWLEQDEASDYPEAGWKEVVETLKRGQPGAVWRASGVTRGLRDSFYKNSQHGQDDPPLRYVSHKEDGRWTVHRVIAQARPNWTNEERTEKIMQYGSKDDPDYRRNVLGSHGDSQSPLFVSSRLFAGVDDDPSTEFNTEEYWHFAIKDTELDRMQTDILDLLVPPSIHTSRYKTFWMGADIGYTQDPTEIVIFAEYPLGADEKRETKARSKVVPIDGASRLKMIGRITLKRIAEPAQADVIVALINHYRPQVFAMDSTGAGLPLFQQVQRIMHDLADDSRSGRARNAAESIKGYNFSAKILVDFDETVEVEGLTMDDQIKESGITRNVLEYATDCLRTYVDEGRLWLPWDTELLAEMQGQTFSYSKTQMDRYGRRRIFSQGSYHALDALRMLAIGHKQFAIEAMVAQKEPETLPVLDMVVTHEMLGDW